MARGYADEIGAVEKRSGSRALQRILATYCSPIWPCYRDEGLPQSGNVCASWNSDGWGGRDRTYECRNQNPVPYHLATPQRKPGFRCLVPWTALSLLSRELRERMPCERAREMSIDMRRQQRECVTRLALRRTCGEHATPRAGHARLRRCTRKHGDGCGDLGKSRAGHGRKIVSAITRGKDVHFRRGCRTCQFRRREDVGRAHVNAREGKRVSGPWRRVASDPRRCVPRWDRRRDSS